MRGEEGGSDPEDGVVDPCPPPSRAWTGVGVVCVTGMAARGRVERSRADALDRNPSRSVARVASLIATGLPTGLRAGTGAAVAAVTVPWAVSPPATLCSKRLIHDMAGSHKSVRAGNARSTRCTPQHRLGLNPSLCGFCSDRASANWAAEIAISPVAYACTGALEQPMPIFTLVYADH